MIDLPFDPINRARETEMAVMQGNRRKYHRFRAAPYYGGIATADAVGCCFLCGYCWNYLKILKPQNFGKYYSPHDVADNILRIVRKKGYKRCRITGCEPILGDASFNHLIKVINRVLERQRGLTFILETNGLFLGYQPEFIKDLKFSKLAVRVAVKGWDEASFRHITGADEKYFEYPLIGLKKMQDEGLNAWPAVMWETFGEQGIEALKIRLSSMGIDSEIEVEVLEKYPYVMENIDKRKIMIL